MKRLSPEALSVLSDAIHIVGFSIQIVQPLDRQLYIEVNAALEAIGGKWSRKDKAHLFDGDPEDALDQILVDGGFHDRKRDLDQFFTPPEVARSILKGINLKGKRVLEPSAGQGSLVRAAIEAGAKEILAIEIDPKNYNALSKMSRTSSAPIGLIQANFLDLPLSGVDFQADVVVMNPPFSKRQDILHVNRALDLAPKSSLIAIVSAGALFRQDRLAGDFRKRIHGLGGTITFLPEKSFAESGTNVNTALVRVIR